MAKAKKKGDQHDFILLDRSGSMATLWAEALGSVNAYVEELAKKKVATHVTLAVFDESEGRIDFRILRDNITPSKWEDVSPDEINPRGLTPLNDAAGKVVNLAKQGNYEKAAIIIMTDGYENASKELTVQQAKAALDECRAKNWQVIFLGANFDNASQGASYGNAPQSTVSVTQGNLRSSAAKMSQTRASYAATGESMQFTDEDKEELAKKKAK
jgi:uncharacterized protein with von Willebrand factor type A (vWA) domain